MKAVYRSIKPYWLYLILIGQKTIEVGKTFPKADDWNKEVLLYCSKDMKSFKRIPEKDREWMRKYLGRCACRFVCDFIYHNISFECEQSCVSVSELKEYSNGKPLYGWHISDLVIYDKPRELGEFRTPCKMGEMLCSICDYVVHGMDGDLIDCNTSLTRPPQSWCYVEVQG